MKDTNQTKLHLDAKFYIDDRSHFISSMNESYNDSFKRQESLTRKRIASVGEIKLFCGTMKKRYINSIIPFSIDIIKGARVMLLQNLDLSTGLINGARGTVIEYINSVDSASVMFDFQGKAPILIMRKNSIEYQINQGKKIYMYMFPLKLSWAVTAHKSQGQTLLKAAINISENEFVYGSFYVALSRVKSLKNLMLFGLEQWPKGGPNFHMNPFIQSKENEQADNDFL